MTTLTTLYYLDCPKYCCQSDQTCTIQEALKLTPPVVGCRDRIGDYSTKYMQKVFIISVIFIVAQVSTK